MAAPGASALRKEWTGGGSIATHYQAIGFDADTLEAFEAQVMQAASAARRHPCGPEMDLSVWEDSSGAVLWIQAQAGALVGAHPFFAPATRHTARIEGTQADPESPLDGQVRLYILPGESVLLLVDVVNWPLAVGALRQQAVLTVRIAAFAESWQAWETLEAYEAAHVDARRRGHRWIVPTGLYPLDKGGTGRATASIVGVVESAEVRVNGQTGAPFLWMRVATSGATLDVVAADGPLPRPGAVMRGHFWLAGMVEKTAPDSLLNVIVKDDH